MAIALVTFSSCSNEENVIEGSGLNGDKELVHSQSQGELLEFLKENEISDPTLNVEEKIQEFSDQDLLDQAVLQKQKTN